MADPKDNLRPPWKPGESGNPSGGAGRPKDRPIAAALKALGSKDDDAAIKALVAVIWKKALKGDIRTIKELMERIDGKVLAELDVTSGGESIPTLNPAGQAALDEFLLDRGKAKMDGE